MGCDLNSWRLTYKALEAAVEQKLVTEEQIDTALKRLLTTKFKLGLFDNQDRVPWSHTPAAIIDCAEHRNLARKAAVESSVVLKNTGVLPFAKTAESILVTGPTAASVDALLGNYNGISSQMVTLAEGISERVAEGTRLAYPARGAPW